MFTCILVPVSLPWVMASGRRGCVLFGFGSARAILTASIRGKWLMEGPSRGGRRLLSGGLGTTGCQRP